MPAKDEASAGKRRHRELDDDWVYRCAAGDPEFKGRSAEW
jgi:hypothetical protein